MKDVTRQSIWRRFGQHKVAIAALLAGAAAFSLVTVAHAQSFRSGNNTTLAAGQTVDGSLYAAGRTIDLAGTVNGDIFCAGQNITISGTVNGDVICGGQTLRIDGVVHGDVRAAGQSVTVDAQVTGSATLAGQTVTTSSKSRIGRDMTVAGQDVTLNGSVGRDVVAGSGSGIFNGLIGRNVSAGVDHLRLGSDADVKGNITYTSRNQLQRDSGADVVGRVTQNQPQQTRSDEGSPWLFTLWWLVAMLVFALLVALSMPQTVHRAAAAARLRPGRTLLVGFVASIIVPIGIVVLMATLLGLVAGLVALVAWILLVALSGPFAAYAFGRWILEQFNRTDNVVWAMLVGALVLLVVYLIPIIGWIVMLFALWYGLGMLLRHLAAMRDSNYDATVVVPKPPRKPAAATTDD